MIEVAKAQRGAPISPSGRVFERFPVALGEDVQAADEMPAIIQCAVVLTRRRHLHVNHGAVGPVGQVQLLHVGRRIGSPGRRLQLP